MTSIDTSSDKTLRTPTGDHHADASRRLSQKRSYQTWTLTLRVCLILPSCLITLHEAAARTTGFPHRLPLHLSVCRASRPAVSLLDLHPVLALLSVPSSVRHRRSSSCHAHSLDVVRCSSSTCKISFPHCCEISSTGDSDFALEVVVAVRHNSHRCCSTAARFQGWGWPTESLRAGRADHRRRVSGDASVETGGDLVSLLEIATTKENEYEGEKTEADEDENEHQNPAPMGRPPASPVSVFRSG